MFDTIPPLNSKHVNVHICMYEEKDICVFVCVEMFFLQNKTFNFFFERNVLNSSFLARGHVIVDRIEQKNRYGILNIQQRKVYKNISSSKVQKATIKFD